MSRRKDGAAKREGRVSLHPVPPQEAVADLLKVKPQPKKKKKKMRRRKAAPEDH